MSAPGPETGDPRGRGLRLVLLLALAAGAAVAQELPASDPGTHQRVLSTSSGFELRYAIRIPDGYSTRKTVPLVVSLHHGWGRSRPYPEYFGREMLHGLVAPGLHELGAVIVAPDSHGMGWDEPEIAVAVYDLVERVLADYAVDPKRVAVTGFSSGGVGALKTAARFPELFSAVIPIASRLEPETVYAIRAPVFVIHSRADERIPFAPTERMVRELKREGYPIDLLAVDELGHRQTGRYRIPLEDAVSWLEKNWGAGS